MGTNVVVLVSLGPICLYFLVTGIVALVRGRTEVLNPHQPSLPTDPLSIFMNIAQDQVQRDYPVPDAFIPKGSTVVLTGRDLYLRAIARITFGVLILVIIATSLVETFRNWLFNIIVPFT
jgi:hypothetical protein